MKTSTRQRTLMKDFEWGNGMVINNEYRVGKQIGRGNFGEVREAYILQEENGMIVETEKKVAVKLESSNARIPQLHAESRFYQLLSSSSVNGLENGVAENHYFGKFNVGSKCYNALVLTLLGPNLEECFEKCDRKFSLNTVTKIAVQLITRLEFIHSKGIIFRDIKPENFVVGRSPLQSRIFIVDFGLAKEYRDSHGKHIRFRENKSLTGTARYMSINTHLRYEQSRRDDLESLGHVLLYLLRGSLPWQGLIIEDVKERYKKIGEIKQNTSLAKLCENQPKEVQRYMAYVRQLGFSEDPDYDLLKKLFIGLFEKEGYQEDDAFDWSARKWSATSSSDSPFLKPPIPRLKLYSMNNMPEMSAGSNLTRGSHTGTQVIINVPNKSPKRSKWARWRRYTPFCFRSKRFKTT